MKPKYFCTECNSQIQWADKFCASCGQPVEWPVAGASVNAEAAKSEQGSHLQSGAEPRSLTCSMCGSVNPPDAYRCQECGASLGTSKGKKSEASQETPRPRHQKESPRESAMMGSWKMLAGFVAFIAVGVLALEYFTGNKRLPEPAMVTQSVPGANMQVLPQIEELEKRVAANPDDASLLLQLSHLFHDNRFYDKAIVSYGKYLELNPKNADARVDLGICYHDTGNFEEARRQMERALKDNPKHLLGHFNLGIVNLSAGNIEAANEWFRKTIALAPNSEVAQQAQHIMDQHSNLPKSSTN